MGRRDGVRAMRTIGVLVGVRVGVLVGVLAGMLVAGVQACGRQPAAPERPSLDEMAAWLDEHGVEPVAFTSSLFEGADLVLVGEVHEVADSCAFVASLLEPLYRQAGVRVLATEFLRSALNERVHALVTAESWDEDAAIDLFRAAPWPTWGYREYLDILKSAWSLNHGLPDGATPLRVVGIDDDWRQIELLEADRMDRFQMVRDREAHMTEVLAAATLEAGVKAVAHVGFAHSVFIGGERLGTRLRDTYGDRVAHLVLHHEMQTRDGRSAITRDLEAVLERRGAEPVAFRVPGSPLGQLHDPGAMYVRVLGPEARFQSFIEHYALLKPVDAQRPVSWIPGFIRQDRLAEAIEVGERIGWIERGTVTTVEQANEAFARRLAP